MRRNRHQNFPSTPHWILLGAALLLLASPAMAQAPGPGNAPDHAGPPAEVAESLLERGFTQLVPDVFVRHEPTDGSYETVAYGVEGHRFLVRQQEEWVAVLERRQEGEWLDSRQQAIDQRRAWITELEQLIADLEAAAPAATGASHSTGTTAGLEVRWVTEDGPRGASVESLSAAASCSTTFSRSASANPTSSGPDAQASASYSDSCGEGSVTVLADTYAEGRDGGGILNGDLQKCERPGTGAESCAASASVNAVTDCLSNATGAVTISDGFTGVTFSVTDSNTVCRLLSASFDGPTCIEVSGIAAVGHTWTASVSGGQPAYTYTWRYNGVVVGSNSSYTRFYSNLSGDNRTDLDQLSLTVDDTSAKTPAVTLSRTLAVKYGDGGGGFPIFCPTEFEEP